ncbi:hypothetical protein MKX01_009412, partial [Papaver californicum]
VRLTPHLGHHFTLTKHYSILPAIMVAVVFCHHFLCYSGKKGGQNYIGRILEFFKTEEGEDYVRIQWFYRAEDTVILLILSTSIYSNLVNDNLLDCLVSKLEIAHLPPNVNLRSSRSVASCDYFYDMNYYLEYATFCNTMSGNQCTGIQTVCNNDNSNLGKVNVVVLDLYSGCCGMSTGLCLSSKLSSVRWKGYSPSADTWEPSKGLSNCQDKIRDFVTEGSKKKILPLPSGYNHFRNVDAPLDDEKNQQIIIFMDIVRFLKPKYVLMENVADILRFADGVLGRYALSRLVHMNYQARVGIIAAGCYGLPQFRLRTFLWGVHPSVKLPQFPLPTHDVIVRYGGPREFERCIVAYDEGQPRRLEKALVLWDALSDLPEVTTHETRDEMPYKDDPLTEFQKYIRSSKSEMLCSGLKDEVKIERSLLYDRCPNPLSEDDFLRVCQIPQKKGANFRDLPGVIVGSDSIAILDPKMERILLTSGKPLVPDYALTLGHGKSRRPFARLWCDETVPTVITMPNCHALAVLHPEQNWIISIRESARLQGFPDYYRFHGNVQGKLLFYFGRYRQVGNAVAVSVSRALGYALGTAWLKLSGDEPLMMLPPKFSLSNTNQLLHSLSSPEIEQQRLKSR